MNRFNLENGLYQELLVRQLRGQIDLLREVLDSVENSRTDEADYVRASLREANVGINRLRKFVEAS